MKLPCTVIEDMLPLYIDGICADETEALVEEHLQQCPKCCDMLINMRASLELPEEPEDLKPLQAIKERWEKSKRVYVRKGICVTLVILLVAASVLSGVWYVSYGKYYYWMAECMDPIPEEAIDMGSADCMKEINGCRIGIWLPPVLSNSGFVRITDETGMVMFIYPQVGGSYAVKVSVHENENQFYMVWLNPDMTPNFEEHSVPVRTDQEKERIVQLLDRQRDRIMNMCATVKSLWGIELLDETAVAPRLLAH